MRVFIFDLDGVLVEPAGYLRALQDTVAHFSRRMGLGELFPDKDQVQVFEANGLTSEWEIAAACVGVLLVERLRRQAEPRLPASWESALAFLQERPCLLSRPDYAAWAEEFGRLCHGQVSAAEATRQVLEKHLWNLPTCADMTRAGVLLLHELLTNIHDFYAAPVTRFFQHLAIGSERIPEVYGVPAEVESISCLQRYDRPLLSSRAREQLLAALSQDTSAALCTLRPSLAPAESGTPLLGFSPEAELAGSLVGLDGLPCVGLGSMLWLSQETGRPVQQLIKPFAVQALAAIAAALAFQAGRPGTVQRPVTECLRSSYALQFQGKICPPWRDLDHTTVHVFEDTSSGLRAFEQAIASLRALGLPVDWHPHGIAPQGSVKAAALRACGAEIHPSVNHAFAKSMR